MSIENNFKEITEYVNIVENNFGIKIQSRGYGEQGGKSFGHYELPKAFINYKSSDYYFQNSDLIHFTSLESLIHIINSGYFLATQFSNHDDPSELLFAGKEMKKMVSLEKIEKLKKYLFSLSLCPYTKKSDSFPMWRLYGNNGWGVGIVLKFYPNIDTWQGSFLSSVYYGNENTKMNKFRNFSLSHIKFIKKYKDFPIENKFGNFDFKDSLALFLAFHKNQIFQDEVEVRFLKSFLNEMYLFNDKNDSMALKINNRLDLSYAYKIPLLCSKNLALSANQSVADFEKDFKAGTEISIFKDLVKDKPFVVLEKVILGYRYKRKEFYVQKEALKNHINKELNSKSFEVEFSHLSNEFYGEQEVA